MQRHNALTSAQRAREDAFRRVGRVRGMTIAGAGALTAGVAGFVSAVAPGHSLAARAKLTAVPRTAPAVPARSGLRMPPLASASQLGLQAPGAAPQSVAPGEAGSSEGGGAPAQQPAPQSSAPAQPQPVQPQPVAPAPASGGGVVSGGS